MGTPQDVNRGLDLFRTLVFDNAVDLALTAYAGSILAIPVIGPLAKMAAEGFADYLYKQLQGVVVLETVLFVDLAHRQAFATASTNLEKIAMTKGVDSKEFKDAHEIEKQALKKFGQFGIVRPGLVNPPTRGGDGSH